MTRRKTLESLSLCPFCGSKPVVRIQDEEYLVFCNGCFTVSDTSKSEKESAEKWNRRANPWRDIASVPKDGSTVDLWINGYRVTNCQWDQAKEEWTEGWLDDKGNYQSLVVMWALPTYWMLIPESPEG